ncbi:hypothetical protein [Eubacterium sp.]|uniref:hypothetical protein n=1 Tax=Eubacterium sp. TaxID=142586 RepID=UPI0025E999FC|nr:hypothetical protein [Eubacterium sp.]MCR5629643.1 hypothetical protein [Eubacterium sp.]
MGAKALYKDTRRNIIRQLIIEKDIEAIKKLLKDRDEYRQYAHGWKAVNLDEFIAKFDIQSDTYNMVTNKRKISFFNDGHEYEIVAAIGGKYFRVREIGTGRSGGRYVGLDLREPRIPGSFQGAARREERNRLTHFRMSYKKGTV